ncbi:MAG: hypothetical protein IJ600_00425 [Lachnospiraceae bacterium]|nr:hypothetical protein [Lachnospiraceae bacterium]
MKRNHRIWAGTACVCLILLAGCGSRQKETGQGVHQSSGMLTIDGSEIGLGSESIENSLPKSNAEAKNPGTSTLSQQTGYIAPQGTEDNAEKYSSRTDLKQERERAGLTDAAVERRMRQQAGHYYYDTLEEGKRKLYTELLMIMELHAENILISTTDADALQEVFFCVFQDHPELFWVDGYAYRRYNSGSDSYYTFSGKYTYTAEECAAYQPLIDSYVSNCLKEMPFGGREYDTVKYVYEYVISNTDYVLKARDNQNILSVFVYGESVCQGYAKAVQYLLQQAGVSCTMVVGKVGEGEGHAWNLVNIDGAYYYVDATWGDAGYLAAEGGGSGLKDGISYNYLNITTDEILRTHKIDNVLPLPYCIHTEANYFVREGTMFTAYDRSKLSGLFSEAAQSGERCVNIKCGSEAVYNAFMQNLLQKQEVFGLMPEGTTSVDYMTDDDLYTICFWF